MGSRESDPKIRLPQMGDYSITKNNPGVYFGNLRLEQTWAYQDSFVAYNP